MSDVLKPLRIGPIEVDMPVMLAPLAGYSDLPYRMLCRRMGARYCTTEMMLDRLLSSRHGRQTATLLASCPEDTPTAGQLIGNEPEEMARAAGELCKIGFDVIDLNFACPVNKALRRRRGGWLMQEPEQIERITRAVLAVADRPVTVKVRQRFGSAETSDNGYEVTARCLDAGAAAVTMHARSVGVKYAGPADWDFLASLRQRHPQAVLIGSGDILSPAHALRMLRETGVNGVIVARGGIGNPWFFRQVQDLAAGREIHRPSLQEQREVMLEHFTAALELYGPQVGPKIMRKFGIKYARMHPNPRILRMAFVAVHTPDDWHRVLDRYYCPGYHAGGETVPAATAGIPDASDDWENDE